MIINIPDEEEDKITFAKLDMLKQSLELCGNHVQAAKYMGVSVRVVNNWFNQYPELKPYRNTRKEGNDKWMLYPDY